jgi:autotransporter-associated beta strand protein
MTTRGVCEMGTKLCQSILLIVFLAAIAATAQATDLAVLQENYVDQKYGLFMHYSMGTYTNEEWAHSGVSINLFNPTGGLVDTDQWAQVAVEAGMKYGVLTSKHHDGFALWDTDQSTYDVASTSWYATYHQDIVADYVTSFRNAGLGVGIYYSVWDKYNGIGPKLYGDDVTLGEKTPAAATAYVKAEINHLLTAYGHIDVLWIDGWGWQNTTNGVPYYQKYPEDITYINYTELYDYIKSVSPDTLLINNVNEGTTAHTDVVGYETQYSGQMPPVGNTIPSEGNATLRSDNHWFDTGYTTNYKSASYVGAVTLMMNSRNSSYLLDVPPDDTGTIPVASVTRLEEIKTYLAATPGLRSGNLAYGKTATQSSTWSSSYPASKATDDDRTNISHTATSDTNPWWKVDLGSMTSIGEIELFNRVIECSGRLRDITVEILAADGTTVLYTSDLLNPGNIMGGGVSDYANGPTRLCLFVNDGTPVTGRYIRVRRTAESSGSSNLDDLRALSLSDVEVYAVRPGDIKWTGANGGVWDVNTTANWFNTAALISDKYRVSPTADAVTFSDLYNNVYGNAFAPSTTAVTLNTTVSPSAVVFDADTLNYSISGTGGISGGTSLIKSGAGTLTISTSNSFTGGTMLTGGILAISSDAALGAVTGELTINKTGAASAVLKITASLTLADSRPLIIGTGGGVIEVSGLSKTLTVAPLSSTAITIEGPLTVQGSGTLCIDLAEAPTITATQTLTIAGGASPTTLNAGGSADPFTSGAVSLDVVNNGNFNITAGSKKVGALSGTGNTLLAAGTQLTADSIAQNTLTIGAGSKLTIAPIGGGPLADAGTLNAVPEPSTWAMLMLAVMGLGMYWRRASGLKTSILKIFR